MSKPFFKAYLDDDGIIRTMWFINLSGIEQPYISQEPEVGDHKKKEWVPPEIHKKNLKKIRKFKKRTGRKDKNGKRQGAKKRVDKLEPPLDDGYRMKSSFHRPYFTSKDKRKYEKYIESIDEFTREEYNWLYIYCLLIWNKEYVGRRKRSKRNR